MSSGSSRGGRGGGMMGRPSPYDRMDRFGGGGGGGASMGGGMSGYRGRGRGNLKGIYFMAVTTSIYSYYTVILLLYSYYTLIILLSYCYLFIIEWPLPITRVYFFKISKKRHISSVLLEG